MERPISTHWARNWWAGVLAALLVPIAIVAIFAALLDAGYFRGPLIRWITARTGRDIRVDGPAEMYLFTRNPRIVAERIAIANPPWTTPGTMAEIGRLSLVFDLPFFAPSFGLHSLAMEGATLHLLRDPAGHANWQWREPGVKRGQGPPLFRGFSMRNAHVELDDARRHLQFNGTVSAQGAPREGGLQPFRIEGSGQLNRRAARFAINAEPLATVSRERPYHFDFDERSSGSHLTGQGVLSRPFDFRALDATFESTGADMKDLYFLVGVNLPNSGAYHLSGKFARRGTNFSFNELRATSGKSDVHGTLVIDTSGGRSHVNADLYSNLLRLSDLGLRAAGRDPTPLAEQPLIPDTKFPLNGIRRSNSVFHYHAHGVDVGRAPLYAVAAKVTISEGVLNVPQFSASFAGGQIAGHAKMDATREVPTGSLDFRFTDVRLEQLPRKEQTLPPLAEGLMRARVSLTGRGRSLHEFAAASNGTITSVVPRGAIRGSLAVLTGMDFRAPGLRLTKNKQETGVRCGVASFDAHDGLLTAQNLVIDTDPALITGTGKIRLDSEGVDLTLRGHPKHLRLRLRAPVTVRGTLRHPLFGVEAGGAAAQAGAAVALGVVLTPLAAVLAFVDPGLAKDADCAALIASVTPDSGRTNDSRSRAQPLPQ